MLSNFKSFSYNGRTINQRADGFINLTQMCKANGKRIDNFLRLRQTQDYIRALKQSLQSEVLVSVNGGNVSDVGTWGHQLVAEELQRWIDKHLNKTLNKIGVLYIYLDEGNSAYKVGFTANLRTREKSHKSSNPFIKLVKVYRDVDIDFESLVHLKLKKYRISGTSEWYNKNIEVLSIIQMLFDDFDN